MRKTKSILTIIILLCAAPSLAPLGFQHTSVNSTSISLTWEPPPADGTSGTITQYKLTFSCRPYYHYQCRRTSYYASDTLYEKSQLNSGLEYTITVAACSVIGCGSRTSTLIVILPREGISCMHAISCQDGTACMYGPLIPIF